MSQHQGHRPQPDWGKISWTALPIVISAIALFVSIRQASLTSETTGSTVYERQFAITLDLSKAFLANSDLRDYFYENRHVDKTDPNFHRIDALAEMTLDTYEIVLTTIREHASRYPNPEEYYLWIKDGFKMSEALRQCLDRRAGWYSKQLRDLRNSN